MVSGPPATREQFLVAAERVTSRSHLALWALVVKGFDAPSWATRPYGKRSWRCARAASSSASA
jgi:hypothetical protein